MQIVRRFYRSWWKRPFWLLGLLLLAVVAGRIALTPTLTKYLRQQLAQRVGEGTVTFSDLDLYLFPPTFVFRDVALRAPAAEGRAGTELIVPRVEVHASSWQALVQPSPTLRMRLDRPALRLSTSSQDLDRIARALPAARLEIVTVSEGSISNGAAPDGRPVIAGISGELEGLASGGDVGRTKWQFWGDGQLLGDDPLHLVIGGEPSGAWRATVAGREAETAGGSGTPARAMTYDGDAAGSPGRAKALLHVRWTGDEPPIALAEERSRSLDERWPSTELRLVEVRPAAAADGRTLELVLEQGQAGIEPPAPRGADRASQAVGLVLGMVRLGNRALASPAPGLAALNGGAP